MTIQSVKTANNFRTKNIKQLLSPTETELAYLIVSFADDVII